MHLKNLVFLQLFIVSVSLNCYSQSQSKNEQFIRGKLQLDSIWEPVVYLSQIPAFKDMYTMSNEMIIAEAKIDSTGAFHFPAKVLPNDDYIYRIHLSKKEAPPASLIIGGQEENHIFFIANRNSDINIRNTVGNGLFGEYHIEGYRPNDDLKIINTIINKAEVTDLKESALKKEFVDKTLHEQLRHIADTSAHPIVSLYALNHSKFESTFLEHQKFYETYLEKWETENSSYFKELRNKLPKSEPSSLLWYIIIGISFFALGYIINYNLVSKRKKNDNPLKSLSVQERKIFMLIQSGKSNKEISEVCNIGLSTVKSHVSNIYSKLNIKSRKEAMNIK